MPERKALLAIMTDNKTNIHTKRRPNDQTTSSAHHMATILLQRFFDGFPISVQTRTLNANGVSQNALQEFAHLNFSSLSDTLDPLSLL